MFFHGNKLWYGSSDTHPARGNTSYFSLFSERNGMDGVDIDHETETSGQKGTATKDNSQVAVFIGRGDWIRTSDH